ncbi:MAG: PQQ-binding-like beta-propeller repeat protein [Candidatus Anstonellaceae archaeon]
MKKKNQLILLFFFILGIFYGGYSWEDQHLAQSKINYWLLNDSRNVYYLTESGVIYELSTISGETKIIYNAYKKLATPAILSNQNIIFGTLDGEIISYSIPNKKISWTYSLNKKDPNSSAKLKYLNGNEKIVVAIYDKKMIGLSPEKGSEIFSKNLEDGKAVNVVEEKVLVLDKEELYCYNLFGKLIWFAKVGEAYKTLPVYDKENDIVFFASATSSTLFAFQATTGSLLWYYMTDGFIMSEPLVVKNKVIFGTPKGEIIALDAKEGKEIYKKVLSQPIILRGQLLDKYAFFSTANNLVIGLNTENGEIVFNHYVKTQPTYPLLFKNTILVPTKTSKIYSLTLTPSCSILSPMDGEEVGVQTTIEGIAFSTNKIKNVQIILDGERLPPFAPEIDGKFSTEISLEGKSNGPIKIDCIATDENGQVEKNNLKYKLEVIFNSLKQSARIYAYITEGQILNPGQEFELNVQDKYAKNLDKIMIEYLGKKSEYGSPIKLRAPTEPGVYTIDIKRLGYEGIKINFEVKDNLFIVKLILVVIIFIIGYGITFKYLKKESKNK